MCLCLSICTISCQRTSSHSLLSYQQVSFSSHFVDSKYSLFTLSLFLRTNWFLLALCFLVNHEQEAKRGLLIMEASGLDGLCLALNNHTQNLSPGQSVSYLKSYCQQSKCVVWAAFLGLTPTVRYNRFTNPWCSVNLAKIIVKILSKSTILNIIFFLKSRLLIIKTELKAQPSTKDCGLVLIL